MRKFVIFLIVMILNMYISPLCMAREISKANKVYKNCKDGVVTIFTSIGHGSGFLIDDSGLILTNSHVVNETGEDLRIRFRPGVVVAGKVLAHDRNSDVALVLVNLKNVKNYKVLKPFNPPEGEPLLYIGEKIAVIGSPLEWETLEKTISEGIVGKYENDIIRYDADTNPGNSGGPIFNFDSYVVGIHAFVEPNPRGGKGVGGSVAINKAYPLIDQVAKDRETFKYPSPDLLPDIPKTSFPMNILVSDKYIIDEDRDDEYKFISKNFIFKIHTPPMIYRMLAIKDNLIMEKRLKRAKKKKFEISFDELDILNEFKYYSYYKPVVTIEIMPRAKLTKRNKVFKAFALVGAGALTVLSCGILAPTFVTPFLINTKEFKKDFLKMTLKSKDGKLSFIPYSSGREPYKTLTAYMIGEYYEELIDKSYTGKYEFDPRCFDSEKPLELEITSEGDKETLIVDFPDEIKKKILEDFELYWKYLKENKSVQNEELADFPDFDSYEDNYNYACKFLLYGNYNDAIIYLNKALKIDPDNDMALAKLGESYHQSREYQKALDAYRKALESNPENIIAKYNIIEVEDIINNKST